MADKDLETEKLELSFFRRKRKKATSDPDPEVRSTETPAAAAPPPQPATSSTAPAEEAAAGTSAAPAAGGTRSTGTTTTDDTQVLPPTTARAETTDQQIGAQPAPQTDPQPDPQPEPRAGRSGGARVARKPRRQRQPVQLPSIDPGLAALAVGAVVGVAAVALTFASLQLCELVTSTDSCGGPGLVVLLAVVVLMILGGSAALRMFGVSEPGGLSFLGVAMFVAVCLVALLPNLLEVWMIGVAPLLCALTFWVAHWIVTRFDEEILEDDGPPPHDVR